VRIGDRDYVDGGVWSVTNLDAAPARRETEVLCLDPTASLRSPHAPRPFACDLGRACRFLRRRGARVRHVGPRRRGRRGDGHRLHGHEPAAAAQAAGHRQGRALARTPPPSGA
jgi:NTE family protein